MGYLWNSSGTTCTMHLHSPSTLVSTAKLNSTGHRWVSELADYNFDIKYRPGKVNKDADTLSRLPMDIDQYIPSCTQETSQEVISATLVWCNGTSAWWNGLDNRSKWQDGDTGSRIWYSWFQEIWQNWASCHLGKSKNGIQVLVECWHTNWNGRKTSLPMKFVEKLPYTRKLLREWPKLDVGKDGLLRRRCGEHLPHTSRVEIIITISIENCTKNKSWGMFESLTSLSPIRNQALEQGWLMAAVNSRK